MDLLTLQGHVDHWLDQYDWRRTEAEINAWPQYLVQAGGEQVHLLHARADDPTALPLVLTHGWPGSIVEFLEQETLELVAGEDVVVDHDSADVGVALLAAISVIVFPLACDRAGH